jgi:tetratricopeptide (TPR) repeat protein
MLFPMVIRTFLALLLLALSCSADTLYLKNGISLTVSGVREVGEKIEYTIGATRYTIAKSAVDRIEKDRNAAPGLDVQVQEVKPGAAIKIPSEDENRLLRPIERAASAEKAGAEGGPDRDRASADDASLHHLDERELAGLEKNVPPVAAARGYLDAARYELAHGDRALGIAYMQRAVTLAPGDAALLSWYVSALIRAGRYSDALPQAERMAELAPSRPEAFTLLGLALYHADQTERAVRAWKQSVELRPDPAVQQLLAKAERELSAEGGFRRQESVHFTVHYEGQLSNDGLAAQMLQSLESGYAELSRDLELSPREPITVVIYSKKPFFDVTQAPAWAGGMYDGKLRIPVEGLERLTPDLARVLKHELTHSFLALLTDQRCPGWLQEGLAQAFEPRSLPMPGRLLAQVFEQKKQIPLQQLRGTFGGLDRAQAAIAYSESLAAVQYLQSRFALSGVQDILKRIASGNSAEQALQAVTGMDYEDLEKNLGAYLAETYR